MEELSLFAILSLEMYRLEKTLNLSPQDDSIKKTSRKIKKKSSVNQLSRQNTLSKCLYSIITLSPNQCWDVPVFVTNETYVWAQKH